MNAEQLSRSFARSGDVNARRRLEHGSGFVPRSHANPGLRPVLAFIARLIGGAGGGVLFSGPHGGRTGAFWPRRERLGALAGSALATSHVVQRDDVYEPACVRPV